MSLDQLLKKYGIIVDKDAFFEELMQKHNIHQASVIKKDNKFYTPSTSQVSNIIGSEKTAQPMFPAKFTKEGYCAAIDRLTDEKCLDTIRSEFQKIDNKIMANRVNQLAGFNHKAKDYISQIEDDEDNAGLRLSDEFMKYLNALNPLKYIRLSDKPKYSALAKAMLDYLKSAGFFVPELERRFDSDNMYDLFNNGIIPEDTTDPSLDNVIKKIDILPYVSFIVYDGEKIYKILPGSCSIYKFRNERGY